MKGKQASKNDKFSYARPEDPLLRKGIIREVERLTGSKHLQHIYRQLKAEGTTRLLHFGETLGRSNTHIVS